MFVIRRHQMKVLCQSNSFEGTGRVLDHSLISEPLHIKTGLKIFILLILKEDLADTSLVKSFGMTPTIKSDR